jgi:serine/threonine-protein kinase
MAPEQCRGKKVDARADSYAFGLLLYEMLTGKPPFEGDDALELMLKHTDEEPVPPSRVAPSLPAAVDPIILSLLEKQPEERPLELAPVVRELEAIASGETKDAGTTSRWWRGPALVAGVGLAAVMVFAFTRDPTPTGSARGAIVTTPPEPAVPPLADQPQPKATSVATVPVIAGSASAAPLASSSSPRPVRRGPAPSAIAPGPEDPENPFGR